MAYTVIPGAEVVLRGSVRGKGRVWSGEEPGRQASSLAGPPLPNRTPSLFSVMLLHRGHVARCSVHSWPTVEEVVETWVREANE